MAKRFVEWEYKPGEELVLKFKPVDLPMVPDSTKEHLKQARKEILLAVRSLLDAAIDYAAQTEKPKGKARTKIEVQ